MTLYLSTNPAIRGQAVQFCVARFHVSEAEAEVMLLATALTRPGHQAGLLERYRVARRRLGAA